jgi:hypothetical protein
MSTQQQASFDFTAPPPSPRPGEVEELVRFLHTNPGFHKAREIGEFMHLTERQIRQLAEASDGRIISGPGSPGYCHLDHCPAEKLAHIADTLRSQARRMLARSIRIRKRAHLIIR